MEVGVVKVAAGAAAGNRTWTSNVEFLPQIPLNADQLHERSFSCGARTTALRHRPHCTAAPSPHGQQAGSARRGGVPGAGVCGAVPASGCGRRVVDMGGAIAAARDSHGA